MAASIFARIDTIKGESQDAKHKDEIEILSWSWGMSQSGTMATGRRRRRREGELPRLQLHPSRRQGLAAPDEGVCHR